MILPPGELVFPSGSTSAQEMARKENALKNRDVNAYNLLMDLRQTCKRPHPTIKFGATFPTDSPVTFDSIEVGDQANFSAGASILGANCVTDLSGSYGGEVKINQVDHSSKSIAGEAGTTAALRAVMKDARYAKLLGARGIVVNSDVKGLVMARQLGETSGTGKGLITFNLNGSFLSLDADIPYSMTFKALIKGNEDKSSTTELLVTASIQVPGVNADVVFHSLTSSSVNGPSTSTGEIYVNGKQLTERELKDLLGDTSETIVGHSAAVNGLLLK
jgi:hypothetical protein